MRGTAESSRELLHLIGADLAAHGVVDAHHHMWGDGQRRVADPGLWEWLQDSYLWLGLRGSGYVMPPAEADPDQRIASLLPYLRVTSATTYYEIVREGLEAVHGFDLDTLDADNWRELDRSLHQLNAQRGRTAALAAEHMGPVNGVLDRHVGGTLAAATGTRPPPDWYEFLARERPGLDSAVVEAKTRVREVDGYSSAQAIKIDTLLYGHLECCRPEMQRLFGGAPQQIRDLDGYLDYVDEVVAGIVRNPATVALKSAIAGVRSLDFSRLDRAGAAGALGRTPDSLTTEQIVAFENVVMDFLCARAGHYGLPLQIHTGAGPGGRNTEERCRPSLLVPLILRHPATPFELLHGAYPNWAESATLAERFANVHLNASWLLMISDSQARLALDCWLDQVPSNKITWGGDCTYLEETIGTYRVALRQVSAVLGQRMADGRMTMAQARSHAGRLFRENALELFGLQRPGPAPSSAAGA